MGTQGAERGVEGGGRGSGFPGRNYRCFSMASFCFYCYLLLSSLVRIPSSWGGPRRRAKWGLQRAALARTADENQTLCISS